MKKVWIMGLILLASYQQANAQNYDAAIGIRLGSTNALSGKVFFDGNKALEGLVGSRWGGAHVALLLEFQNSIGDVSGLEWFYGFGPHIGIGVNGSSLNDNDDDLFLLGASGIVGLEYTFKDAPVSLSLDYKPALNIIGDTDLHLNGGAFTIRYTIK